MISGCGDVEPHQDQRDIPEEYMKARGRRPEIGGYKPGSNLSEKREIQRPMDCLRGAVPLVRRSRQQRLWREHSQPNPQQHQRADQQPGIIVDSMLEQVGFGRRQKRIMRSGYGLGGIPLPYQQQNHRPVNGNLQPCIFCSLPMASDDRRHGRF